MINNGDDNNRANAMQKNNPNNDIPNIYPSYPPLFPGNSNNQNNARQSFNFEANDEPWIGVDLDQVVNAQPSTYLTGSNPTNLDFANPFGLESGSSMNDLWSLALGQGFETEFMPQGDGEGY